MERVDSMMSTSSSDPRKTQEASHDGTNGEVGGNETFDAYEEAENASQVGWKTRAESDGSLMDNLGGMNSGSAQDTGSAGNGGSQRSKSRRKTFRVLKAQGQSDESTGELRPAVTTLASEMSMHDLSRVTVESKITSAQLERVMSKRKGGKEPSRGPGHKKRASMPVESEVDRRFVAVLETMDLTDEQLQQLRTCPVEKKWQMICDATHRDDDVTRTPRYLTEKLANILRDKNYKDACQLIKTMEILLRSSQVHWMNVFVSPGVDGLGVVLNLLETIQKIVRAERMKNPLSSYHVKVDERRTSSDKAARDLGKSKGSLKKKWQRSASQLVVGTQDTMKPSTRRTSAFLRRKTRSGGSDEIEHLNLSFDFPALAHEIMLLIRAIMNSEVGFTAVINDRHALNLIAASIIDTLPKTRMLVLEILTASCMMEGAHSRIVEAMDYNRRVYNEECRFQTLVNYFRDPPDSSTQDYLCALMNFFNLVVHSSPNLNFRVHLQYDLTSLGFDDLIRIYREDSNLNPLFEKQINAYVDNFLDVQSLLDNFDNPRHSAADDNLTQENQRLREDLANNETRYVAKIAELEGNLRDMRRSIEMLTEPEQLLVSSLSRQPSTGSNCNQLKPAANRTQPAEISTTGDTSESADTVVVPLPSAAASTTAAKKELERRISDAKTVLDRTASVTRENVSESNHSNTTAPQTPSIAAAAPPPPPPMCMPPGAGVPPPPPGMMVKQSSKVIKTKYKMPALNWQVMHRKSWNSTIFANVNSELYQSLDMVNFEESFKLKVQPGDEKDNSGAKKFTAPQVRTAKVLDSNFCRSIGILRKKLHLPAKDLVEQVNNYLCEDCDVDLLEQLAKFCPSSSELQKFERYEKNNTITTLSDEEIFVWELYRVPRFKAKLRSVVYMMKFESTVNFVQPQLQAVYVAGSAVVSSQALRRMFELIMALGNYVNSGRRGWTSAFQITSLDNLKSMKSTDGSRSLMNYLAEFVADNDEYNNIFNELVGLDRAAQVVLSQMSGELSQLVNGLMLLRAEDKKANEKGNELSKFLEKARQVVPDLERTCKRAQEVFQEAAEYLGEAFKNQTPGEIFGPVARFLRELRAAGLENEAQKKSAAEESKKQATKKAIKTQRDMAMSNHRKTADQLNEILQKGNPLNVGNRQASASGFMDDMINASKVVAYRAGVSGSGR